MSFPVSKLRLEGNTGQGTSWTLSLFSACLLVSQGTLRLLEASFSDALECLRVAFASSDFAVAPVLRCLRRRPGGRGETVLAPSLHAAGTDGTADVAGDVLLQCLQIAAADGVSRSPASAAGGRIGTTATSAAAAAPAASGDSWWAECKELAEVFRALHAAKRACCSSGHSLTPQRRQRLWRHLAQQTVIAYEANPMIQHSFMQQQQREKPVLQQLLQDAAAPPPSAPAAAAALAAARTQQPLRCALYTLLLGEVLAAVVQCYIRCTSSCSTSGSPMEKMACYPTEAAAAAAAIFDLTEGLPDAHIAVLKQALVSRRPSLLHPYSAVAAGVA